MRLISLATLLTTLIFATAASAASDRVTLDELERTAIALPGPYNDVEPHGERVQRLKLIARIIVEESSNSTSWQWSQADLAWAVFVKTWHESSRFMLEVHNGTKRGDHGKSVCLGQIMNGGESLVGTDEGSTRRCIAKVIEILNLHQKRCVDGYAPSFIAMADIFSGYGTGRSCKSSVFFYKKDSNGNTILDKQGQPIKIYWAKDRAKMWLLLRENKHPVQRNST